MGGECRDPRFLDPGHFTPGERARGTHWIRVGPNACLEEMEV
jgi:hypothetical protein